MYCVGKMQPLLCVKAGGIHSFQCALKREFKSSVIRLVRNYRAFTEHQGTLVELVEALCYKPEGLGFDSR
jgi:hypothetical protein